MAESDVDPTIIQDNSKVAKADMREQLQIIKDELTDLMNKTAIPRRMAFNDAEFDTV
jgi:hypothetical protein